MLPVRRGDLSDVIIIGDGLLAQGLRRVGISSDEPFLIQAAGVSNSGEIRPEAFSREKDLVNQCLRQIPSQGYYVYFSTLSIKDPSLADSLYIQHKLEVEDLIRSKAPASLILRAPNIIGSGGNPNTMINTFAAKILSGEESLLWEKAYRNFLDVDDLARIVKLILSEPENWKNKCLDLEHPVSYPVDRIFNMVSDVLGREGSFRKVPKGAPYLQGTDSEVFDLFERAGVNTNEDYLKRVLIKYLKGN